MAEAARSPRQGALLGAVALAAALVACDGPGRSIADAPPALVERVVPARTAVDARPPLLVLLHGIGADENDLVPLAARLDPRLTVVSLRAPRRYEGHGGYAWFQIDWRSDGTIVPDAAQARAAVADLDRWIAAAPGRLGTDPARLYLLGFSQGAMMSLGALRTGPDRLAGVIALSGAFRDDLVAAPAAPEAVGRVPVFVAHGTRDGVLPIAEGRAIRDAFQPLVHDFTYREYPIAHGTSGDELADVARWLTQRLNDPR